MEVGRLMNMGSRVLTGEGRRRDSVRSLTRTVCVLDRTCVCAEPALLLVCTQLVVAVVSESSFPGVSSHAS